MSNYSMNTVSEAGVSGKTSDMQNNLQSCVYNTRRKRKKNYREMSGLCKELHDETSKSGRFSRNGKKTWAKYANFETDDTHSDGMDTDTDANKCELMHRRSSVTLIEVDLSNSVTCKAAKHYTSKEKVVYDNVAQLINICSDFSHLKSIRLQVKHANTNKHMFYASVDKSHFYGKALKLVETIKEATIGKGNVCLIEFNCAANVFTHESRYDHYAVQLLADIIANITKCQLDVTIHRILRTGNSVEVENSNNKFPVWAIVCTKDVTVKPNLLYSSAVSDVDKEPSLHYRMTEANNHLPHRNSKGHRSRISSRHCRLSSKSTQTDAQQYVLTKYLCRYCDAAISDKINLRAHEDGHLMGDLNSDQLLFYCETCDVRFPSCFTFKCHVKEHLIEAEFLAQEALWEEMLRAGCDSDSESGDDGSDVDETKDTATAGALTSENDIQQSGSNNIDPDNLVFKLVKPYNRQGRQTPMSERPYSCSTCHKRFIHKRNLDAHTYTHQERVFPCEVCGMKFRNPSAITTHRVVHEKVRQGRQCEDCGAVMISAKGYYLHKNKFCPKVKLKLAEHKAT